MKKNMRPVVVIAVATILAIAAMVIGLSFNRPEPAKQADRAGWEYGMLYSHQDNPTYDWVSAEGSVSGNFVELMKGLAEAKIIDGPVTEYTMPKLWDGLGADGWELVSIAPVPSGKMMLYAFKRPKGP